MCGKGRGVESATEVERNDTKDGSTQTIRLMEDVRRLWMRYRLRSVCGFNRCQALMSGRRTDRKTRKQMKHDPLLHSVAPCKSYLYYLLISVNSSAWTPKVMNLIECCACHVSDPWFCVSVVLSLQLCGYIVLLQSRVAISNRMERPWVPFYKISITS